MRVLLLGGTTEANRLALALAKRNDIAATLSLAGRTSKPAASPLPTRSGGFGGTEGLAAFLHQEAVAAVVDATHPFAARISINAVEACRLADVPLAVLSRPAWDERVGERWSRVVDLEGAVRHLAGLPAQAVFLTTGRLGVEAYRRAPQHAYLIRTIEPPEPAVLPSQATVMLARGPFAIEDEIATMQRHKTTLLVSKNSGGAGGATKLQAARRLGIPVVMIERPAVPDRTVFDDPAAVMVWLDVHRASP